MTQNPSSTDLSNQDLSTKIDAKMFFAKLEKDGPTLDKVGEVYVKHLSGQSRKMQSSKESQPKNTEEVNNQVNLSQETDSLISPSRQLQKLRIDIMKEFSENKDLNITAQEDLTKNKPIE